MHTIFPRTPCAPMPLPCPDKRSRRDSGGKVGFKGGQIVITCLSARHKGIPEVQDGLDGEESWISPAKRVVSPGNLNFQVLYPKNSQEPRVQYIRSYSTDSQPSPKKARSTLSSESPTERWAEFKGRSTPFSHLIHHNPLINPLLTRECFIDGEPPLLSPRLHKATGLFLMTRVSLPNTFMCRTLPLAESKVAPSVWCRSPPVKSRSQLFVRPCCPERSMSASICLEIVDVYAPYW